METFAIHYGYVAVFLGTIVEGEVFILLGGFLAHRGYIGLAQVIVVAAVGAFLGDITYFALGHFYGRSLLEKSRRASQMLPWLERFMERFHALWIFGVRYLWGMRWLAAVLAGASKVKFTSYSTIDILACLVWALSIGLLGYGAGEALERTLGDLKRYETLLLIVLVVVGIVYGIAAYLRESRFSRSPDTSTGETPSPERHS